MELVAQDANMIFHFNDIYETIKHLSFILEASRFGKVNIKIKESMGNNIIYESLLEYSNTKEVSKDLKRLFKALDRHTKLIHDIETQKAAIGFVQNAAVNDDDIDYEEEEEDEE